MYRHPMPAPEASVAGHSLRETAAALTAAARADDGATVKQLLGQLGDQADAVADAGEVRAIVRVRDRLDRVARAVRELPEGSAMRAYACGYLDDADRRLDRARTRTVGAQVAERSKQNAEGVRDRVLALLAQPHRPREIAEQLSLDPAQVSRAISELTATEAVVRVSAPHGTGDDRRAHWYAQRQLDVSTAA